MSGNPDVLSLLALGFSDAPDGTPRRKYGGDQTIHTPVTSLTAVVCRSSARKTFHWFHFSAMQSCALRRVAVVLTALSGGLLARAAEPAPDIPPDIALSRVIEGNKRFVAGSLAHPDQTSERRVEVARGQHPFAVVLTCADSRLSPEIIFDQGLGDLFVIRNAGNLLDDHVIGSIEYAIEHLHASLVIVLGHSACGAVSAAVAGGEVPGHLPSIVESLAPAVGMARKKPGDAVENAVRINAKLSAAALAQSQPVLAAATLGGQVKIVAARYDLATGQVEFLP